MQVQINWRTKMSIDGNVLGAGAVGGTGAGAASTLLNTGSPLLVALIAATAIIVIAGLVARYSRQSS